MFNIKKINLCALLLLPVSLFTVSIVEYKPEYKDAVIEISLQNKDTLFSDSGLEKKVSYAFAGLGVATGLVGRQFSNSIVRNAFYVGAAGYALVSGVIRLDSAFDFSKKKERMVEAMLQDDSKNKSILVDSQDKVIGFVVTYKDKESTLEDIRKKYAFSNERVDAATLRQAFPDAKETEEECKEYSKIECLAIDKDQRRKGFGKLLMNSGIHKAQEENASWAELDVASHNKSAIALYEKIGFTRSEVQPNGFGLLGIVQYRKALS
ncbi:MAG: ribosomal protein S18 acetylase RimI-like enzyme [Alteromonas naphthalenivorans]|jgi:ribosomal protein S18 acetylase RimI-like enzyme